MLGVEFLLKFLLLLAVLQAMMSGLMHWALADWPALVEDFDNMGLLKPNTDKQRLALELQQQFEQLYSTSTTVSNSQTQATGTAPRSSSASAAAAAGGQPLPCVQQTPLAKQSKHQQTSVLLATAGAISFGDFAAVVAALALRFRFYLPPWYTLVIRSLTTLEGFALLVDPQARSSIARSAVKVRGRWLG